MVTYHGGPFDGDDFGDDSLCFTVERAVDSLDVTPDDIVSPRRRVDVSAIYRWDGAERLDFDRIEADFRLVHL